MSGDASFCKAAQKVAFGKEMDNVATIQSLAGSGALYLGANFCNRYHPKERKSIFQIQHGNLILLFLGMLDYII